MKSCQEISFHPIFSHLHRQGIFLQRGIDRRKRWDKITLIKTHLVICYWLAKSKGQKPNPLTLLPFRLTERNSSHSPLLTQNPKGSEKKESSGERENQVTKQRGRKTSFPETKKGLHLFLFFFFYFRQKSLANQQLTQWRKKEVHEERNSEEREIIPENNSKEKYPKRRNCE